MKSAFTFKYEKMTQYDLANLLFFTLTKVTPINIHINILELSLRICDQFEHLTMNDFIKDSGEFVNDSRASLAVSVVYDLLLGALNYFNLTVDTLRLNEWYKDGIISGLEISDFFDDDTQPIKFIDENDVPDSFAISNNSSAFDDFVNGLELD